MVFEPPWRTTTRIATRAAHRQKQGMKATAKRTVHAHERKEIEICFERYPDAATKACVISATLDGMSNTYNYDRMVRD